MSSDGFFERVYQVTQLVPYGRITTYGAIARSIGSPQASRMVGWALNNCHTREDFIPAHRVVNRNGMLSGKHHFRTPTLMEELLKNEGVEVKNDKVSNFNELFWEPPVLDPDE